MKLYPLPCALLLSLSACGTDGGGGGPDRGDGGEVLPHHVDPTAGDGTVSDAGGASDGSGPGGSSGGGSDSGGPTAEICDGLDNDGDGQIDDIDVEGDGVCDCLNIATIGQIGGWSNGGNVFRTWLDMRSPLGAVEIGDQVLTDELLRPFQVIVVLHVGTTEEAGGRHVLTPHHAFSEEEVAVLERWVRGGGGLMTTIGYSDENAEVVNVNRLLVPLGMEYSTTKQNTHGFVEDWENHAITDGVMRIRTDNGVEPDSDDGVTLARDGASRVALQVGQPDGGRVIVWGDEWITYDSEWEDTDDQQVERFWLNMFKWLSPPQVCQVDIPIII